MLMKRKTCAKESIPPRKNILNCSRCVIFKKKQKHNQKEQPLKKNHKVNILMMNQKVNK